MLVCEQTECQSQVNLQLKIESVLSKQRCWLGNIF